jgi:hypothetical protein
MEREFLIGIDFGLYVDKATYESWLNLLKGLVWAKEMDSKHWRRSRGYARVPRHLHPQSSGPSSRTYSRHRISHRARSTSPGFSKLATPPYNINDTYPIRSSANADASWSPSLRLGSKRSAAAAFSPTSATFAHIPAKRPVSMSLVIPECVPGNGSSSNSPLEPLQSFAKLSIGSSPGGPPSSQRASATTFDPSTKQDNVPTTLVTAYSVDERRRAVAPQASASLFRPHQLVLTSLRLLQNLYFYSLACSPMENAEESRCRKAKLRYHQPPPPTTYYHPPRPIPVDIQSASTSPRDFHMNLAALPHLHDTAWSQQNSYKAALAPVYTGYSTPPHQDVAHCVKRSVPSAPFANAGPPGVQFYYPAPGPTQHVSPVYSRGRSFQ